MVAYVKQVAFTLADVGISYLCNIIALFCNCMDNAHMHACNILSAIRHYYVMIVALFRNYRFCNVHVYVTIVLV